MSRIVLIGKNGFIGSNIIKNINADIYAPDRKTLDLCDYESLNATLRSDDIVLNSAGYAHATDNTLSGKNKFHDINVLGIENLIKACIKKNVRQLIHISSVAAMGRQFGSDIKEEHHNEPENCYGYSKLKGEEILKRYSKYIPITILRPTSVFGENRGLCGILCKIARKTKIIPLPNSGNTLIPFSYVGNIVKCIELSINNPKCFGEVFIVGDKKSYKLRDILCCLSVYFNNNLSILPLPSFMAFGGVKAYASICKATNKIPIIDLPRLKTICVSVEYCIDKFEKATGYKQYYSFEESIKKIGDYYKLGQW